MKAWLGFLPTALIGIGVITTTGPDSTTARAPGYGGVLVVPVADDEASPASLEEFLSTRRLPPRGRVLDAGSRVGRPAERPVERPGTRQAPSAPTASRALPAAAARTASAASACAPNT